MKLHSGKGKSIFSFDYCKFLHFENWWKSRCIFIIEVMGRNSQTIKIIHLEIMVFVVMSS